MTTAQQGLSFTNGGDPTLALGAINDHGQRCCGRLGVPGTEKDAYAYKMECTLCGYVYGANSGDVHERRCPNCLEGPPGIRFWLIPRKVPASGTNGGSQAMRVERVAVETGADWIDRVGGSMKDMPESDLDEFLKYCRLAREEDRPPDDADEP
jgi:rubredoxin